MLNEIHKVQVGDLVRSVKDGPSTEIFMVMEVTEPIGYSYRGRRDKTHEISLKLWEVTEPPNHTHRAPSNLYEIV